MAKITVHKNCLVCGLGSIIEVDPDKWIKYVDGLKTHKSAATHGVQVLFPELSPGEREVIISGTHPECWDKLFGNEVD